MVTLFCFLDGSSLDLPFSIDIDEAFSVDIDEGRFIDHLKDEVKKKLSPALDNIVAAKLSLYRVSVPGEDNDELRRVIECIDSKQDKLNVFDRVGDIFPSPAAEHIHVIIQPPSMLPS